jgi:hypothetical protein
MAKHGSGPVKEKELALVTTILSLLFCFFDTVL